MRKAPELTVIKEAHEATSPSGFKSAMDTPALVQQALSPKSLMRREDIDQSKYPSKPSYKSAFHEKLRQE